jgi:hypothetical protein
MIGAITWNEHWDVPTDIEEENQVCTHQLGRNVILLTSTVASIAINQYLGGFDHLSIGPGDATYLVPAYHPLNL